VPRNAKSMNKKETKRKAVRILELESFTLSNFIFPLIYCALQSRCMRARGKESLPGRVEGSSRAMLAIARPSCYLIRDVSKQIDRSLQSQ